MLSRRLDYHSDCSVWLVKGVLIYNSVTVWLLVASRLRLWASATLLIADSGISASVRCGVQYNSVTVRLLLADCGCARRLHYRFTRRVSSPEFVVAKVDHCALMVQSRGCTERSTNTSVRVDADLARAPDGGGRWGRVWERFFLYLVSHMET